ncbi:hypothetical protein DES40_0797 [Litorimonas taeanensis]|uniref:Acetyltransferase n=1 Tax=Litorimonas taeanensis TaxID=568099 RepID=A0A420WKM3_9PROT|nr:DHH family phosphoesterase [Litorimonas taeanensis]RKQ71476.1 hypothetical protein DES40_0797 [Litorimonas taeanensis]
MADFDVFNGDADGIISLVQLRLADPRDSKLITGRKRDIALLDRVEAKSGDRVTVLDISLSKNRIPLQRILEAGAGVYYFDHHHADPIPKHPNLETFIDTSPEICTALLVDDYLGEAYRAWAVTAAFGDNFPALAKKKGRRLRIPLEGLERLGVLINYNGYGADLDDLHFHPADLYNELVQYETPMAFLEANTTVYQALEEGYQADRKVMSDGEAIIETDTHYALVLPNVAASRRMSGVHGNSLAQNHPDRAHAILTLKEGGYLVSIRSPLTRRKGADELAMQFDTGGGRSAAAGINHLAEADLNNFLKRFQQSFL